MVDVWQGYVFSVSIRYFLMLTSTFLPCSARSNLVRKPPESWEAFRTRRRVVPHRFPTRRGGLRVVDIGRSVNPGSNHGRDAHVANRTGVHV
ncbi:hypothetical protein ROP_pROB01-03620 (plasmid) [Rhodococcus opacus B4]|uniref:Uncharacterized protein n=1 Tax=Rhodococcus opacus (strain B4) TaxID=632772 RepID=C1BDB7_RHOOB|nr:hypothetical protein ROP_pROB01-03620 [Rhodococcus opacus B4]